MSLVIGGGISFGGGISVTADNTGLYNFSSFTFLSGNVSGPVGATGTQLFANSYSNVGNTWLQSTSFYNTYGNGYQFWTVPATGTYQITAAGARSGIPYFTPGNVANGNVTAGWGAVMSGSFNLTQGQVLTLVVGQMSGNAGAGELIVLLAVVVQVGLLLILTNHCLLQAVAQAAATLQVVFLTVLKVVTLLQEQAVAVVSMVRLVVLMV